MVLFDQTNNTGAIDVKMDESVLEEKSSFKMLRLMLNESKGAGFAVTVRVTFKDLSRKVNHL